jgi:DNA-binding transcriptional LysR family regulator
LEWGVAKIRTGDGVPVFSRFTRYFAEVARLGSIRKASEQLNVSASAIDRQILRAEEEFGMALFERLPTGLRPTAAGELLLDAAGRWGHDFARVQAQMSDLRGLRRGRVRLALIDALSEGFVSRLIRDMRREFPGITFEIKVLDNVRVLASIVAGDVDCGLMLNPQSSKDVVVRSHRDVFLGFVTPPGHPFAAVESCRFSRCVGHDMVAPAEPLALCDQVRTLERTAGVGLRVVAACDNIQMIKSLVADGAGIGILSSLDVLEEVRTGALAFTRIADTALKPLTLALCVGHARQLSSAANLFLARLEERLGLAD